MLQTLVIALHIPFWAWLRRKNRNDDDHIKNSELVSNPYIDVIHRLYDQLPTCFEPIPKLPQPLSLTPLIWIESAETLKNAISTHLNKITRIAIDLEHYSQQHTYLGKTCLIQLSTGNIDLVVDTLAISKRDIHHNLQTILADPSVLKIMHGANSDILWLMRDYNLRIVNIFDTEKAAQRLRQLTSISLSHLLMHYIHIDAHDTYEWQRHGLTTADTKKKMQRSDWRIRPLPNTMLEYARGDVHWLLYISDCLVRDLKHADASCISQFPLPKDMCMNETNDHVVDPGSLFSRAVQSSQMLSMIEYRAPDIQFSAFQAAIVILKKIACIHCLNRSTTNNNDDNVFLTESTCMHNRVDEHIVRKIYTVCRWREYTAQRYDEGVQCILLDQIVCQIAYAPRLDNKKDIEHIIENASLSNSNSTTSSNSSSSSSSKVDCAMFPSILLSECASLLKSLTSLNLSSSLSSSLPRINGERQEWERIYSSLIETTRNSLLVQTKDGFANKKQPHNKHKKFQQQQQQQKGVDTDSLRERISLRFATNKRIYENCRMLSKDGELLCYTDQKRLLWYIKKGLAEKIQDEPLSIKLLFEHRNEDQKRGQQAFFYSSARVNCCVSCGIEKHYLRWRVVPSCYRKAMPLKFKSHRSHDVLLLCVLCHEKAQAAVERTKREISREYNIPLFQYESLQPMNDDVHDTDRNRHSDNSDNENNSIKKKNKWQKNAFPHPYAVRKAALALQSSQSPKIPLERRKELTMLIRSYIKIAEPWALVDASSMTRNCGDDFHIDISRDELHAALLAGMSNSVRRRTIRRWMNQNHDEVAQKFIDEVRAAELRATTHGRTPTPSETTTMTMMQISQGQEGVDNTSALSTNSEMVHQHQHVVGHDWHGKQVIQAALLRGGDEEVMLLCSRFRKAFVDTLDPQYLPQGWNIHHNVPRQFGEYSVYNNNKDDDNKDGGEVQEIF